MERKVVIVASFAPTNRCYFFMGVITAGGVFIKKPHLAETPARAALLLNKVERDARHTH